jgi:hypothetical protein
MNHKRYSALILAMALLIIGMRGVCAAQFSQHVEESDTQERSLTIPISTSIELVDEPIRGGFIFRVKRYVRTPATVYAENLWNLWMDW